MAQFKDSSNESVKVSVTEFGAKGDGSTDDTEAIEAACASHSGLILFPQGIYVISRPIVIDMAKTNRVRLFGAGATIRHTGSGPAFHFIGHHRMNANPRHIDPHTYAQAVMPLIDGIVIDGVHPDADGIRLDGTFKATIHSVVVTNCRYGIHIVGNNRNILINGVHVYNNREVGVFLDNVNLHQINISGSHISYNGGGGIKVEEGNIRNIQITGNDIEYNHQKGGSDIWFVAGEIGIREGAITGNTIQALRRPGGANVLIEGFRPDSPLKSGQLSIVGNHISNQSVNVRIVDSQGMVIGNNTMTRGYERNIEIVRSRFIQVNHNVIDGNPDYGDEIVGGILIEDSDECSVQGTTISGSHGGSVARGGSIEMVRCSGLLLSECIVTGSSYRDVWLEDVLESKVSGLMLRQDGEESRLAGVVESGKSDCNMIVHNMVHSTQQEPIQVTGRRTVSDGNVIF